MEVRTAVSRIKMLVLGAALVSGTAPAQTPPPEFGLKAGLEWFHWEEFDQAGDGLLTERGPRFTLGGYWGNDLLARAGGFFSGEARLYLGRVDYDGQTIETGEPVRTDTDYLGGRVEVLAGYRWPGRRADLDLVAGLGLDGWSRSLRDSRLADGTPVRGYEERYSTIELRIGPGLSFDRAGGRGRLAAGLKYPLWTEERLDGAELGCVDDPRLAPGARGSAFAQYAHRMELAGGRVLRLDVYYESRRYARSDPDMVRCYDDPPGPSPFGLYEFALWQPESRMDVVGLQMGLRF